MQFKKIVINLTTEIFFLKGKNSILKEQLHNQKATGFLGKIFSTFHADKGWVT